MPSLQLRNTKDASRAKNSIIKVIALHDLMIFIVTILRSLSSAGPVSEFGMRSFTWLSSQDEWCAP
jgi:hypothetical protein